MQLLLVLLVLPSIVLCLSTGDSRSKQATAGDSLSDVVQHELTHAPQARTQADIAIKSWQELLSKRGPAMAETWAADMQRRLNQLLQRNHSMISGSCRQSLVASLDGVKRLDEWALRRKSHT